jgi:nitrite reductase/ring-hydroxylating ferredoxin subunit/DMSO/TMAO reductase YedYZ heme-binding membrane subunit
MSTGFQAVQWNRHKLVYDALLLAGIGLYVGLFLGLPPLVAAPGPPVTWEIQEIRAAGSGAFVMLTVVLCIGPLARLDRRFLPLLYNRRHFGVLTFLVALAHLGLVLGWYYSRGVLWPPLALLVSSAHWASLAGFPFEILGLAALLVLLVMAATSHDVWLVLLTPPGWKAIHMAVYPAFFLVVAHVALGTMQSEQSPLVPILVGGSAGLVATLHLLAARREAALDRGGPEATDWIEIGPVETIPEGRARIVVPPGGERVAVFRHNGFLSAVTNVCAHQNGPLGEGRVIDGCITCPWHGHQFRLADGCAPPPYTDRIATYRLHRRGTAVLLDPVPLPPGTNVPPLAIDPP